MPICVPQLFLASLLETRQLTIGQFFPLSFVKVPEFFAHFFPPVLKWRIDLSCIPVNKGTNPRLGCIKFTDLYETVHPSVNLSSLCLPTGVKCGKEVCYLLFVQPKWGFISAQLGQLS